MLSRIIAACLPLVPMLMCAIAHAEPAAIAAWKGHQNTVLCLAFSPDGKLLGSVSDDGTLKLWDAATHALIGSLDTALANSNTVKFSPDGKTLYALGKNDELLRLDTSTGKPRSAIKLASPPGGTAAFGVMPDGKTLACVGRGSLRLLSSSDGSEQKSIEDHPKYAVSVVALSPDGKTIYTAGNDKKVTIYDPAAGTVQSMDLKMNPAAMCVSPDGKSLFVSQTDRTVVSFDLTSDTVQTLLDQGVEILSMACDGKQLYIAGTGRGPWAVPVGGGDAIKNVVATDHNIKSICLSPDGHTLATGSLDGDVSLFTLP